MIYRLKVDVRRKSWSETEPESDRTIKAGSLVFPRAGGNAISPLLVGSRPDGYGWHVEVMRDQIEANPAIGWADFDTYLGYVLAGKTVLPNIEPLDIEEGVNLIACWGGASTEPGLKSILLPPAMDDRNYPRWARVLLSRTQGGKLDGIGVAMVYRMKLGNPPADAISKFENVPAIVRFAICKHEKKDGAGARHERGWHPGRCSKCGLDMTVDSGD